MLCELCGKAEATVQVSIEGSSLVACNACKRFGKVSSSLVKEVIGQKKVLIKEDLPAETIVSDYAVKIKQARERLQKTQEEFAQNISEKVSIVKKLESGQFEPPIELARKLERLLKIQLVETYEEGKIDVQKQKRSEGFTIGDFIKLKKTNA